MTTSIEFTLNHQPRKMEVEDGASLLEVLRDQCGILSPKDGCSPTGQCGCCTVIVDDKAIVACQTSMAKVAGKTVLTLGGVDEPERDRYARAFAACGALQCGFCTPGIVMRAKSLLDRGKADDRDGVARLLGSH